MGGAKFDSILGRLRENDGGGGTPGSGTLVVHGIILSNADFPDPGVVQDGWVYYVDADVTDDDPTKTNTNQIFLLGDIIIWDATNTYWRTIGNMYTTRDAVATTFFKAEYNGGSGKLSAQVVGSAVYDNTEFIDAQTGNFIIRGQQASSSSNQTGGVLSFKAGQGDTAGDGGLYQSSGGDNNDTGSGGFHITKGGDAGPNGDGNGGGNYVFGGKSSGVGTSGEAILLSGECDPSVGSSGSVSVYTYNAGSVSGTSGSANIFTGDAPGFTSGWVSIYTGLAGVQRGDIRNNARRFHWSDNPSSNTPNEFMYADSDSSSASSGAYPVFSLVNTNNSQGDADTTFNRSSFIASAENNNIQMWMTAGSELPGPYGYGIEGGQIGTISGHDVEFVRNVLSFDPLVYKRMTLSGTGLNLLRYGVSTGETMALRFEDITGTAYVSIKAPDAITGNYNIILPDTAGALGNVLTVQSVSGSDVFMEYTPIVGTIPLTEDHILIGNASNLADEVPLVVDAEQTFVLTGVDLLTTGEIEISPAIAGKTFVPRDYFILITAEAGTGATDPDISIGTNLGSWDDILAAQTLTAPALGTIYEGTAFVNPTVSIDTDNIRFSINTGASGRTQLEATVLLKGYIV